MQPEPTRTRFGNGARPLPALGVNNPPWRLGALVSLPVSIGQVIVVSNPDKSLSLRRRALSCERRGNVSVPGGEGIGQARGPVIQSVRLPNGPIEAMGKIGQNELEGTGTQGFTRAAASPRFHKRSNLPERIHPLKTLALVRRLPGGGWGIVNTPHHPNHPWPV